MMVRCFRSTLLGKVSWRREADYYRRDRKTQVQQLVQQDHRIKMVLNREEPVCCVAYKSVPLPDWPPEKECSLSIQHHHDQATSTSLLRLHHKVCIWIVKCGMHLSNYMISVSFFVSWIQYFDEDLQNWKEKLLNSTCDTSGCLEPWSLGSCWNLLIAPSFCIICFFLLEGLVFSWLQSDI